MSEIKLSRGIYYSCEHQEWSQNSCDTCRQSAEKEKAEREEADKHRSIPTGGGYTQTQIICCELCQAQIAECHTESNNKEKKYTIQADDCYRDNHRSAEHGEYFACSKCKEKYQQLTLCPWCQEVKENFDNPSCKQCKYEKTSQELYQKYEEYKQAVMNGEKLELDNQIKSNQIKSNQIKSNQIKSNQIKSNQSVNSETNSKPKNYLPYILGGIGVIALIGGLVWYFTRKQANKEE